MNLLYNFKKFLDQNDLKNKSILLAFSGGADSRALFELLHLFKDEYGLSLHLAHVDHNWREESSFEAKMLQKEMKKKKIPFYLKKLEKKYTKNLEENCRLERYGFFKSLYLKYSFDALFIAHQKDDLAETVLKRVLEGSNLFYISAMKEKSIFENMLVFRPLLQTQKKELLKYLNEKTISYIDDITNRDTKFLRAKMREDIFPFLNKNFKKEITHNLATLSSYSNELNSYLEDKLRPLFKTVKKSPLGLFVDLNTLTHPFELRYFLKKISHMEDIDLSRDIIASIISSLLSKKANKRFKVKNIDLFVDRGLFFIIDKSIEFFSKSLNVKEGTFALGSWVVNVAIKSNYQKPTGWRDLFLNNEIRISLPVGSYLFKMPMNKKLKKIWENKKVPAFLRSLVPVVCSDKLTPYDFLSGKIANQKANNFFEITLKLK